MACVNKNAHSEQTRMMIRSSAVPKFSKDRLNTMSLGSDHVKAKINLQE